ncbi:hypothetical protein PLICRDRAFT_176211 [Plicaturopsis crispa FD-325 SS-3]|nr:hypothetical protein PLICRDRAFT_176211 [Plicaturopsis crispa FD-325 SS-3]
MVQTATLGGTAKDVVVAKTGLGVMGMTWTPNPVPDEQAFAAIKAGIDATPAGAKLLLNSGEFYAHDLDVGNLQLLARFFEKYPEYVERTFLSVKGGAKARTLETDASPENLRRSVDAINAALRGTKRLDLFESARVDPKVPIEEAIKTLVGLIKEGKLDHIGLSECSAETLKRANAVHPIAAIEIEVSPTSYEEETKKVLATAQELGVAVVAYSPLGRGLFTGEVKSAADIPEGDIRRHLTRFRDDAIFKHNLGLVDAVNTIAEKKKVTPSQLTLAWVSALGPQVIPIPGSSKASRIVDNAKGGSLDLTSEEKAALDNIVNNYEVKGDRYFGGPEQAHLWG